MTRVAILGAGSWGTALAVVLSRSRVRHEISLWVRNAELAEAIRSSRENRTYLPGQKLPPEIHVASAISAAAAPADVVLVAVPSAHVRAVLAPLVEHLKDGAVVVSATKGLEPRTHLRMSEVIREVCGPRKRPRIAVLSGPSFAQEAARGEPTALVVAAEDSTLAASLQEGLAGPNFRLYRQDDVLGVELAGAMKNVVAIAAGALEGLGLGSNPLAALITRGLREMTRLAVALGAKPETLSGLAGLGDLVLTCTGSLSRNRHVGIELGRGRRLGEILAETHMVAEGVGTTAALLALAGEHAISLPITFEVDRILNHGKAPLDAIRDIMERPQREE